MNVFNVSAKLPFLDGSDYERVKIAAHNAMKETELNYTIVFHLDSYQTIQNVHRFAAKEIMKKAATAGYVATIIIVRLKT